jgi:hypothetical protein
MDAPDPRNYDRVLCGGDLTSVDEVLESIWKGRGRGLAHVSQYLSC